MDRVGGGAHPQGPPLPGRAFGEPGPAVGSGALPPSRARLQEHRLGRRARGRHSQGGGRQGSRRLRRGRAGHAGRAEGPGHAHPAPRRAAGGLAEGTLGPGARAAHLGGQGRARAGSARRQGRLRDGHPAPGHLQGQGRHRGPARPRDGAPRHLVHVRGAREPPAVPARRGAPGARRAHAVPLGLPPPVARRDERWLHHLVPHHGGRGDCSQGRGQGAPGRLPAG
jgi:hypothetical protein